MLVAPSHHAEETSETSHSIVTPHQKGSHTSQERLLENFLAEHNNALLILFIAPSHDSSINRLPVHNSDDLSCGRLKLFAFQGERESWGECAGGEIVALGCEARLLL